MTFKIANRVQAALYIQTSKPKVSNKQTVNQTVDHVSYMIKLSCVIIPELEKRFLRKLCVVVAKQYTIPDLVHSKGEVILTVEPRTHSARNSKVDLYKLSQVGEAKEETQNFDSEGRSLMYTLDFA